MIYLLYGKINYLIEKNLKKIIDDSHIDNMNIIKYDLEQDTISKVINEANSMSLFEDKKIIIVYNSYIFTGSTKKNIEHNIEELEQYFNNINSDTILIFIVNNEKLDERKKITKLVKKIGNVKEYNNVDNISVVKDLFEDYKISTDLIKYLIERVGDDIPLLSKEIEKIKIYKNSDKTIIKEDIDNLTVKSLEINNFKLIDAIISKNKSLAYELYTERIKLNEEPIAIVIAIANQIRIMYQVKQLYLNGYTENDIAKSLNIHPYRVKLAAQNSRKYTEQLLIDYLKQLADLDINIKNGNVDKNLGLELFILQI